jgi:hypothetical protein
LPVVAIRVARTNALASYAAAIVRAWLIARPAVLIVGVEVDLAAIGGVAIAIAVARAATPHLAAA